MEIMRIPLEIIFKEQNPYEILKNYFKYSNLKEDNYRKINKKKFIYLYQNIDKSKSYEEIENIFEIIKDKTKKYKYIKEDTVFNLLINYTEKVLEDLGDQIQCRYKNLLSWRMISHKLDQDVLISAFLAYKDILVGRRRNKFDWNLNIKSNNDRLNKILARGIAENHFHLKGSAPTYYLSWISLMNKLSNRNLSNKEIDGNRLELDIEGNFNVKDSIVIAALLRLVLFYGIQPLENNKENINDLMKYLKDIINTEENLCRRTLLLHVNDIQKEINLIKIFNLEENKSFKVDYALDETIDLSDKSTYIFQGERKLLYECFRRIYLGSKNFDEFKDLFYVYLIIKSKLRAELVQINDKVGFSNFSDYQDRKTEFITKGGEIYNNVASTAILSSIKNQNIVSLETRVTPNKSYIINKNGIVRTDTQICKQIVEDNNNKWENKEIKNRNKWEDEEFENSQEKKYREIKDKFFYVFHFIKKHDIVIENFKDNSILFYECRHKKYRSELKKMSIAIAKLREGNPEIANRVKGIDAASNELVMRPEVYGQTYRFLKNHLPSNNSNKFLYGEFNLKRLRATYHVGEDFLDIVDGLRAIDEAIKFLQLSHGDRLGHAIVLGIDVREWYEKKENKVYLSKQDILDNIAWLIVKIKYFNIENNSMLIYKLKQIYNKYYLEIYADNFVNYESSNSGEIFYEGKDNISIINVDTYMEAWELRGDNPEYYNGYYEKIEQLTFWHRCAKRKGIDNLRKSKLIKNIYLNYEYNPRVKKIGNEKDVLKIEPYMIDIIIKIQKEMQAFVRRRGIGIETNPTSNYLISNFKRYDKHPILNFYNLGLTTDENEVRECTQLFTSINTDDQGVFGTLLENEYALMAIALEKTKDKDGNPKYNQAMIYDWIDRIRKMGIEQSFNDLDNL